MKKIFIIGLIAALCSFWTACKRTHDSERINEFVVEADKSHDPNTIYKSYEATPNDGVVIVTSNIPNLKFSIPAAPGRIKTVKEDRKEKNRYVLIIQPNDNNYKQYTITINANGFLQGKIESVVVKAGQSSGYIVNPKRKITVSTDNMVDGHEFVDLGLPSGTLWATCNVHADKPEDPGEYYAWGETWQKANIGYMGNYQYAKKGRKSYKLTKYCSKKEYGYRRFLRRYVDRLDTLEECDDAASIKWGNNWRTPTRGEWEELINTCKLTWSSGGFELTGPNGNSVFLPYTSLFKGGRPGDLEEGAVYWSSSLQETSPFFAWSTVVICKSGNNRGDSVVNVVPRHRSDGGCVRPVCSPRK